MLNEKAFFFKKIDFIAELSACFPFSKCSLWRNKGRTKFLLHRVSCSCCSQPQAARRVFGEENFHGIPEESSWKHGTIGGEHGSNTSGKREKGDSHSDHLPQHIPSPVSGSDVKNLNHFCRKKSQNWELPALPSSCVMVSHHHHVPQEFHPQFPSLA